MRLRRSTPFAVFAVFMFLILLASGTPSLFAQMPGGPPPPGGGFGGMPPDSNAAMRDSLMKIVMEKIAGKENAPAESVFKNIQILKGRPAGSIPRMMNFGFGRSLGVGCFYCHEQGDWSKDTKRPLKVARDMIKMSATINNDLLSKMDLDLHGGTERPVVNCGTCHRGSPRIGGGPRRPPGPDSARGGAPGQR